jgi:dUTP pyrophosphatase
MNVMKIKIKRLSPKAIIPERSKQSDAGYDLHSIEALPLLPMSREAVSVGFAIEIPKGYYGRIAPRSGLAVRAGIDVLAGVVDSGYRNEIKVVMINLGQGLVSVEEGDRIAQLIIEKCHDVEWEETDELSDSDRGEDGFGSSGN